MPAAARHPNNHRQWLISAGLTIWRVTWITLVLLIAVPPGQAMAAKTPVLVQPSSTGEAKSARQALLKQRASVVGVRKPRPGTTVGGATTPLPKTIVTRRFLTK